MTIEHVKAKFWYIKGSRRRECWSLKKYANNTFSYFVIFAQIYCGKKTKQDLLYGQSIWITFDLKENWPILTSVKFNHCDSMDQKVRPLDQGPRYQIWAQLNEQQAMENFSLSTKSYFSFIFLRRVKFMSGNSSKISFVKLPRINYSKSLNWISGLKTTNFSALKFYGV